MGFVDTLNAVVAELKAAGLEAAADVRDLNPPAVLVTPASLVPPSKLCGTGAMRIVVECVARDSGDLPALTQLEALHATVTTVLGGRLTSDPATFIRRTVSNEPTGLPALRVTMEQPLI